MRRGRGRGFTLVELMAVVALIGVIASLAVMSIKRSRSSDDSDKWANLIRNTVNLVRRRAISTGSTYMIDLRANPNRLQWCQVTDTIGACTTTTTTCPNSGSGMENGIANASGSDAYTDSYFAGADLAMPQGATATFVAATRTLMPSSGGIQIYFGKNGTVDMQYTDVQCPSATAPPTGFTVYLKSNNKAAATEDAERRRKVVVYGLSGRPRIIDSW